MTAALLQLRAGIKAHIAEDPTVIIPMRCPLVSDGFGGQVRIGPAEAQGKARVRLQHESGSVQTNGVRPSGLDTDLSLYVLTDHRSPLEEGDSFDALGHIWTVGPINGFRRHGGLYKTEAPLTKGTAVPINIPGDLAAEALSASEIDLSWTDVGAVNTYSIERKTGSAAFAVVGTAAAGALVFHDSGLEPATLYVYRIRALSGTVFSAYTLEASATTEEQPS
jgi:hypothetical protein